MFFGVVLVASGGGQFFLNLAFSLFGTQRGGPAKVAVFGSALFGSISGSAIANVITIGSVTIPTMMKAGYPPNYAAAIEACASTGGTIMPPIMGSVAFLMAAWLGIPYYKVAIAAAVPGLLYYLVLFLQVDAFAAKANLKGMKRSEITPLRKVLKEGFPFFFGFATLMYYLYLGKENQSPYVASLAVILGCTIKKSTRMKAKDFFRLIEEGGNVQHAPGNNGRRWISHRLLRCYRHWFCFFIGDDRSRRREYRPAADPGGCRESDPWHRAEHYGLLHLFGHRFSSRTDKGWPEQHRGAPLHHLLGRGRQSDTTRCMAGLYRSDHSRFFPQQDCLPCDEIGCGCLPDSFLFCHSTGPRVTAPLLEVIQPLITVIIGCGLMAGGLSGYLHLYGELSPYKRVFVSAAGLLLMIPGWVTDLIGVGLLVVLVILGFFRRSQRHTRTKDRYAA